MIKLDLVKAGDPEIKLLTSIGSLKKQESSGKTSICALLAITKPLMCGSQQTVENSSRDGNARPPDLPPKKTVCMSKATVRTGHGTTDWYQIRKGVHQGCTLSPCLFNLYAEYIMRHAGLDEAQAGIKTAKRNIKNLRYADVTTLMTESEEELKRFLRKVNEESERVGVKLNIQKTNIMASGPITSCQINGEAVETVTDVIF